jgi:hypothetical protein
VVSKRTLGGVVKPQRMLQRKVSGDDGAVVQTKLDTRGRKTRAICIPGPIFRSLPCNHGGLLIFQPQCVDTIGALSTCTAVQGDCDV